MVADFADANTADEMEISVDVRVELTLFEKCTLTSYSISIFDHQPCLIRHDLVNVFITAILR